MPAQFTAGRFKAWSDAGVPLVTARLYTYESGTTTQKNAFTTSSLATPCTYTSDGLGGQYIAMDSRGEAQLWLGSGAYTLILKTAAGGVIWSVDGQINENTYTPAGTGAVSTTTQEKLRESKSLFDWMAADLIAVVQARTGYTAGFRTAMATACDAAWASALANKHDLLAPAGYYESNIYFPWRNTSNSPLLDCQNVTIYGEGPQTEFATYTATGADVFQLNAVKNLHLRNFKISAVLTGSAGAGTNGISITNGYDNVTILDWIAKELPGLDKTSYIDGGKALTVQPDTTANECGLLISRHIADGCAQGFGCDFDPDTMQGKKTQMDIHLDARNCYETVVISNSEASAALTEGILTKIVIKGTSLDAQHDCVIGRGRGIEVDLGINTTKTKAARLLNPSGVQWLASDSIVDACEAYNAINSKIKIYGYKGACDYKVRLGGVSDAAAALALETSYYSNFDFNISGTAATLDVESYTSGSGVVASYNTLTVSPATTSALPAALIAGPKFNHIYGLTDGFWANFPVLPTLSGATVEGGQTYDVQSGRYARVGNIVYFNILLGITAIGGAMAGNLIIKNLPLTSGANAGAISSVTFNYIKGVNIDVGSGYYTLGGVVNNSSSIIALRQMGDNNTPANLTATDITTTCNIWCSGFYEV